MSADRRPQIGLVLGGGGARGAYEVGVLRYVFRHFARSQQSLFQILTGSSVGAVHAAYVTGSLQDKNAMTELVRLWCGMELHEMIHVNWRWIRAQARAKITRRPLVTSAHQARAAGIFETNGLEQLIVRGINWRGVQKSLRTGFVGALAVPATEIATGKVGVFYQSNKFIGEMEWRNDPLISSKRVVIGPRHVLASAAIPLFFPPVSVNGNLYVDGGLRVNTPLSPALRLGAERLLVVSLSSPEPPALKNPAEQASAVADPVYLAGKAFEALTLDAIERDLNTLRMVNGLLEQFVDESDALNTWSRSHRGAAFRKVDAVAIHPSRNLGLLAREALRRIDKVPFLFRRYMDSEEGGGDLLSFFLFDRQYTDLLIELGYADAQAQHQELAELFG